MKLLRRMSRRLRYVLASVVLVLLAGGAFLGYRVISYGYPSEFGIYSMRADGNDPRPITNLISLSGSPPSWAPDGKSVAFEAQGDIYLLEIGSSQPKRLTTAAEWDLTPAFSPDGQTIAFTSDRDEKTGIYLMSADGSNERALSTKDDNEPAWSPDGSTLIFASGRGGAPGLYLVNADGSGLRRLTRSQHYSTGEGSADYSPSWSPDGSRILFTSHRTGGNQAYVMNADGSDQRRLTKTDIEGEALGSVWSPDGSKIALTSGLGKAREIYLMNSDGTGLRKLTTNRVYDGSPQWSRDGSRIGFVTTRGL
jgi:TolB protein